MRKKGKLLTGIFAAALMVSMVVTPVAAAGANYSGDKILNGASISTVQFTKELVMDADANIPAATFEFAIEPKDSSAENGEVIIEADAGTLAVMNGPVVKDNDGKITAPSINAVAFTAGEEKKSDANQGKTVNSDGTVVAKKVSIDFSEVTFTEPGVYRYIITEKTAETGKNQGITNDSTPKRTLDVYVKDNDGKLEFENYVMYSGVVENAPKAEATNADAVAPTPNGAEPENATKTDKYTNTYDTANLTFGKEVTGNQGSKDKYFKFTVTITGAEVGTVYSVDLSHADTSIAANPNAATTCIDEKVDHPLQIVVPPLEESETKTTVSTDFYLQDGQYITIKGLVTGTEYRVTEDAEDYTSTSGISAEENKTLKNGENSISLSDRTSGNIEASSDTGKLLDIYTGYTNTRSGVIPTGIGMSVLPVLCIGLIVICGIIILIVRAHRRES